MTYPNVDLTTIEDKHADLKSKTFIIDEDILPLVEAVALKYPHWQVKAKRFNYSGSLASATELKIYEFDIYEKRENLGTIGLTWYNRERAFWLENHRIANQRERGYGTKTKDLKKAMRHIAKNFSPKVANEKMDEAYGKAHNMMRQLGSQKTSSFRNALQYVLPSLIPHILENWDELSKLCQGDTNVEKEAEKLMDYYREHQIASEISDIPLSKQTVVMIEGSDYILKTAGATVILSSEQLPPHIRLGVGMLKLVEPRVMMKGIGCKIEDNIFVITPPAPNNVISN